MSYNSREVRSDQATLFASDDEYSDAQATIAEAEDIIKTAMSGLYIAVLHHEIGAISEMLEFFNQILEGFGDNILTMVNKPLSGDSIAPDHTGLRLSELAHLLGFHDICHFLVGDILSCVVGEVEEIA